MFQKPLSVKEKFETVLSEQEERWLAEFWAHEGMRETVRKVLLFEIYSHGVFGKGKPVFDPNMNFMISFAGNQTLSHEDKGRMLEAMVAAMQVLTDGFNNLEAFKPISLRENLEEGNPAE